MKKLLLFLGLFSFYFGLFAQMEPFLLLEKPGKKKSRMRFYAGDEVLWRFKEDKTTYSAVIASIGDSSFTTTEALIVPFLEIESILIPKGSGLKAVGINAFWAIPPMVVFSAANNLFNTGRTPVIDEEVWYISGVFACITGMFYLLPEQKKNSLGNKWRLIPIIH